MGNLTFKQASMYFNDMCMRYACHDPCPFKHRVPIHEASQPSACALYILMHQDIADEVLSKYAEAFPIITNRDKYGGLFAERPWKEFAGTCGTAFDCKMVAPCGTCGWWDSVINDNEQEEKHDR